MGSRVIKNNGLERGFPSRWEVFKYLFVQSLRVITSSKNVAVMCAVALIDEPKNPKEGDPVGMNGTNLMVGPEPAMSALLSGLNENFVQNVLMRGVSKDEATELLTLLKNKAEEAARETLGKQPGQTRH